MIRTLLRSSLQLPDKLAGSLDSRAGCAVFDCSVDGSENVDEAMIQTQE